MKIVALVTDASSGIGRMVAQELKAAGFQVYAAARRVDRMEDLKAEGIKPVSLDLTVDDSIRACVDEVLRRPDASMCWSTTPGTALMAPSRMYRWRKAAVSST